MLQAQTKTNKYTRTHVYVMLATNIKLRPKLKKSVTLLLIIYLANPMCKNIVISEVPLWCSWRIWWHCRSYGTACSCSMGSVPGQRTSTCHWCGQKKLSFQLDIDMEIIEVFYIFNTNLGVPIVAKQKRIWLGSMRTQVLSLASLGGLWIMDPALPWAMVYAAWIWHCCDY